MSLGFEDRFRLWLYSIEGDPKLVAAELFQGQSLLGGDSISILGPAQAI
jgi:hypothetical protein